MVKKSIKYSLFQTGYVDNNLTETAWKQNF